MDDGTTQDVHGSERFQIDIEYRHNPQGQDFRLPEFRHGITSASHPISVAFRANANYVREKPRRSPTIYRHEDVSRIDI
jgi:hypothetical protein